MKPRTAKHEGLHHGQRLHDDQQAALVGAVGHEPGEGADEENGAELGGGQRPEGVAAIGQPEHEQGLGDEGQPVPHLGDELATEEEAEVPVIERPEDVVGGVSDAGQRFVLRR